MVVPCQPLAAGRIDGIFDGTGQPSQMRYHHATHSHCDKRRKTKG